MSEHTFKIINFSQQPDTELTNFVSSKQFLSDEYIHKLVQLSIKLGFKLELINQVLKAFLKSTSKSIDICNPEYKSIIDQDKYLETLIDAANKHDNTTTSSNNISNNKKTNQNQLEYDDEDTLEVEEQSYNGNFVDDSHFENYNSSKQHSLNVNLNVNNTNKNDLKSVALPSPSAVVGSAVIKKPLNQQQKNSEYQIQQISKLNDITNLRPIIIDSNDVALINKQIFKFVRVKRVVEYFETRKHKIYVILSSSRKDQIMNSNEKFFKIRDS